MRLKQIHKNLVYSHFFWKLAPESGGLFQTSKNKNTSINLFLAVTGCWVGGFNDTLATILLLSLLCG